MSETTKIQWADATWNPWIGCTKVSPGCANCYAENTTRARVLRSKGHETWGRGAKRSRTSEAYWKLPHKWNETAMLELNDFHAHETLHGGHAHYAKPRTPRIFPSLCDWLDSEVDIQWLADFLEVINDTPNLDWLLLTKRPENFEERIAQASEFLHPEGNIASEWLSGRFPHNVWMITSVENQAMADKRIPELLKIPARIRGLSVEPMLGPVEFSDVTKRSDAVSQLGKKALDGIHWAIFGGESGANARPCNVDWIRSGMEQCKAAGVAAFVKQLGSQPFLAEKSHGIIRDILPKQTDPKGGDMSDWPVDLQVREFPKEVA